MAAAMYMTFLIACWCEIYFQACFQNCLHERKLVNCIAKLHYLGRMMTQIRMSWRCHTLHNACEHTPGWSNIAEWWHMLQTGVTMQNRKAALDTLQEWTRTAVWLRHVERWHTPEWWTHCKMVTCRMVTHFRICTCYTVAKHCKMTVQWKLVTRCRLMKRFRMATYSTVLQNGETLENATCSTTEGAAKFFPNTLEGRPWTAPARSRT
jgi:predicted house-cleaning NTP pyrophosphatase (Maf/HAM1 superfamily)